MNLRASLRKSLKWVFWPALVILALNFENLAADRGWDKLLVRNWTPAIVGDFVSMLQSPWLQYGAALLVGATGALWIDGKLRRRDRSDEPNPKQPGPQDESGTEIPEPEPRFLCPRQLANEPDVSWWHIPVTIDAYAESPVVTWDHCTIELISPRGEGLAIGLRWQADNQPTGSEEATLIHGVERMVPIVVRRDPWGSSDDDPQNPNGLTRITGSAYLRDGNIDKFVMKRGSFVFQLRLKRGAKVWDSTKYRLRVPDKDHGNSGFIMELVSQYF